MSRLRARTWTPFERLVMRYWRKPTYIRRRMIYYRTGVIPSHDELIAHAERIMRTKGVDLDLARLRASRDIEKHIDPVTGMGYNELVEITNDVNGRRWREGRIRWGARVARKRYSPHANRRYPLRGLYRSLPFHPSRPVGPTNDVWFDYGPWVPSDVNPNIYVRREA